MMTSQVLMCRVYESGVLIMYRLLRKHKPPIISLYARNIVQYGTIPYHTSPRDRTERTIWAASFVGAKCAMTKVTTMISFMYIFCCIQGQEDLHVTIFLCKEEAAGSGCIVVSMH